jgi:hypothetical protein
MLFSAVVSNFMFVGNTEYYNLIMHNTSGFNVQYQIKLRNFIIWLQTRNMFTVMMYYI